MASYCQFSKSTFNRSLISNTQYWGGTSYFSDIDFSDGYYSETVNFSFFSFADHSDVRVNGNAIPDVGSLNLTLTDWSVTFTGAGAVSGETIYIVAMDINSSNVSMTNATSNNFTVNY